MMTASPHNGNGRRRKTVPKVELTGRVAGVDACRILTDQDEVVVGSAIDCDLVVPDPITPRRAFRLRHTKEHAGPHDRCDSCWLIEAMPGSRVYVNNDLTRRERLIFGDTITVGCTRFEFAGAQTDHRDLKSQTDVDDLCATLLGGGAVPAGFLSGQPSWRDRLRTKKAAIAGAVTALLLASLLALFWPRHEDFEAIQPPIEVEMLADQSQAPPAESVRSLQDVARKSFDAPPDAQPDVLLASAQPLKDLAVDPLTPTAEPPRPTPAELGPVVHDAGPQLAPVALASLNAPAATVSRETEKLTGGPLPRRLTREEAAEPVPQALASLNAPATPKSLNISTITAAAAAAARQAKPAAAPDFADLRRQNLALRELPTKVEFEAYRGTKVPIARVPEQLGAMEVKAAAVEIDGKVSDAEVAMSFKTGQFKVHAPGNPPVADPPTFCYVAKVTLEGKDYLYISFDCKDPNIGALVLNSGPGTAQLANDDSVEVFLDFDGNRVDYHQLIVNARGDAYAAHCANGDLGINGGGTPWNAGMKTKTTINPQGGNWVCEILVPYAQIPGVPAKGTKIPFNVCRNFRGQKQGGAAGLQNWFSVWEGNSTNYHHPRLFGTLEWP